MNLSSHLIFYECLSQEFNNRAVKELVNYETFDISMKNFIKIGYGWILILILAFWNMCKCRFKNLSECSSFRLKLCTEKHARPFYMFPMSSCWLVLVVKIASNPMLSLDERLINRESYCSTKSNDACENHKIIIIIETYWNCIP